MTLNTAGLNVNEIDEGVYSFSPNKPPTYNSKPWPGCMVVFDADPTSAQLDELLIPYADGQLSDATAQYIVRPRPDTTPPVVTAFTGPATSNTLLVSGLAITATDNVGVTGGGYTTTATPPAASAITTFPLPTTYLFTTEGVKSLWGWVRDAAGNVSAVFAPLSITIVNTGAEFISQPIFQSAGESSITLAYGTADLEGDHYLLEATSNGTDWVTKVADETPGAGKSVTITGLTPTTEYTLLQLRITPLTGNLTPVLSSTVTGTTSSHSPSFSVQPTADNQIDGAIFSYTVSDSLGHTLDIEFYNGSAWSRILSGVAAGAKTYVWTGQAAGSKSGCKFRVSDAGANSWVESSVVATFSTSFPVIASVTPASTQLTIDITAPSGETPDSYNGYHSASAGQPIGSMTQVVGIADPWVLTGLTNGVLRYLKITAIEGAIESLPSVESSGTPAAIWTFDGAAGAFSDASWNIQLDGSGTANLDGSGALILNAPNVVDGVIAYRDRNFTNKIFDVRVKGQATTVYASNPLSLLRGACMPTFLNPADLTGYYQVFHHKFFHYSGVLQLWLTYYDAATVEQVYDFSDNTWKTVIAYGGSVANTVALATTYDLEMISTATEWYCIIRNAAGTIIETTPSVLWSATRAFSADPLRLHAGEIDGTNVAGNIKLLEWEDIG